MKNGQDYIMALTSNRNDACKPIFAKANWISLHDNTAPISRPQKKKKAQKKAQKILFCPPKLKIRNKLWKWTLLNFK